MLINRCDFWLEIIGVFIMVVDLVSVCVYVLFVLYFIILFMLILLLMLLLLLLGIIELLGCRSTKGNMSWFTLLILLSRHCWNSGLWSTSHVIRLWECLLDFRLYIFEFSHLKWLIFLSQFLLLFLLKLLLLLLDDLKVFLSVVLGLYAVQLQLTSVAVHWVQKISYCCSIMATFHNHFLNSF